MKTRFRNSRYRKIALIGSSIVFFLCFQSFAIDKAKISVDVNKPGHAIAPNLFGIFFEDINLSADGGIYPELVRNRSFEDADTLQNWKFTSANNQSKALVCTANVLSRQPVTPLNAFNRKSLLIDANGLFKMENEGYFGMNAVQGNSYTFKMAARTSTNFNSSVKVRLVGSNGKELASGEIKGFDEKWQYFSLTLTPSTTDPKAHLEISGEGTGKLYLDMVSLMPDKTWKNSGLRVDLAQAIDALHPKFFRFPGGCWVEGEDFEHMYHWKNTIGNIDSRTSLWNIWGYNATHGLGYHEYLQMAEDLGAEPLFCINAGVSHKETVSTDRIGPWIQDALDAIEYANGPLTSVWGSIRAKNGHPAPFNLKYLEIGNENFGKEYFANYELIAKAVLAKYPDMKLIANDWSGGHPTEPSPELIDEHYYNNPDWFVLNATKYDGYDRKGPKIFIGEYAVTSGSGKGNLRGAIGEAAWMTGMERNSDIVEMGAYAPLFCNANHKRWPINLINYDSYRWYGLPSYYVQEMFANNQGTVTLPVNVEGGPQVEMPSSSGRIGLGTWNNTAEFKDLKVVAPDGKMLYQSDFSKSIDDWTKTGQGDWSVKDGILKQSAIATGVTAFVGDKSWKNYTVTLKARKLSGENGFQIYFHNTGKGERIRWDIGGYNNTTNEMQIGLNAGSMKGSLEPGRWYDVKLEILDNAVKGYLDGKLVQEVSNGQLNTKSICASASRDDKSGDIIVKVVNTAAIAVKTTIALQGVTNITGTGTAIVLTSANALDENTLDAPTKVAPKTETVKFSGTKINRSFPANSLTILRLSNNK
ncbi:alpha-L-arabinofuranosidase C-terminal domain-containing protein [Paludibacter jiangxiensis]|uniref:non-reducing end alpha-L-arabinofuranosidase n=1 Tax=Paludibacter jiangxiensis TaxID=681398 RepID=A0A171AF93_9BACT|nr:alpha-L-arabinofuranosidase C-terminal domain-containing protein [Paludibacter jiangxiensis]GAT63639.1 alpha-L-arabinofuranosidase C-terminal protein [Paludibacter jiangxiensis]